MLKLFTLEKILEIHDYNLVKQTRAEAYAEGFAKGYAEGLAESITEYKLEVAKKLLSIQIPLEQIAMVTGLSLEDVEKLAV